MIKKILLCIFIIQFNSCNKKEIIYNRNNEKFQFIKIDEKGLIVMGNKKNNKPFGRFVYFDSTNEIRKLEWYSKSIKPYYFVEFKNGEIISHNINMQLLDSNDFKVLVLPKKYDKGEVSIIAKYNVPFHFIQWESNYIPTQLSKVLFDNSEIFLFENIKNEKKLKLKFSLKNENGIILKTDSFTIN